MSGGTCTTSSAYGNSIPTKQCIFPFKYDGKTYHECASVESSHGPWCSYEVDNFGNAVIGKWGVCDAGCPGLGI